MSYIQGKPEGFREAKETKHMNTMFEKGNLVRAKVATQGMTLGGNYVITHVIFTDSPTGTIVTYILENGYEELRIRNGHMLLTLVAR
jgi:hypothetical protein